MEDDRKEREIVIIRTFEARRELIWKAWTDQDLVQKWWGPNGFKITTHHMDVREGGTWLFTMHGPDGKDYENKIRYVELLEPEKIVYKHGDVGNDDDFTTTVTLIDEEGQTNLRMRMVFPTVEARKKAVEMYGAIIGANQTLSRLAEHLQNY